MNILGLLIFLKEWKAKLKKKFKLSGSCKRCGGCCRYDINWVFFGSEEEKQTRLEALKARGYNIRQVGKMVIQAEFPMVCKQLEGKENNCLLHATNKPRQCKIYPYELLTDDMESYGLDLNKILTNGCGFKFIEQSDV